jgi:hypothetical protein|tara:strand:- start:1656 stop:1859 length:204 start_codon:yes stop_codon:yes gene_type:complete
MSFLKKSIAKYFRPPVTHDVSELAESPEMTDEIEKVLWELNGKLGLNAEEIKSAVFSLKKRKLYNKK